MTFEVTAASTPDLRVLVSRDGGGTWQAVSPSVRRTGAAAFELSVSGLTGLGGPGGAGAVRVVWPARGAAAGLTGVMLTSGQ